MPIIPALDVLGLNNAPAKKAFAIVQAAEGIGFGEHAQPLALRSVAVDLVYVAELNTYADQTVSSMIENS